MAEALQNPKPETGNAQRVRGPNLRVLITGANGVPFQEALKRADAENLVLASNKRMTKAFVETDEWKGIREAFTCWTGTMTGYAKPGAKLCKFVEYTDPEDGQKYVFPVPEQYKGKDDAILVAEHPNYTLVPDGKTLVVKASEVDCITQFPKEDGWYLGDSAHDIPTGKKVDSPDGKTRYLWRVENRVGPVRRVDVFNGYGGQYVVLKFGSSNGLGLVVESPEGDAAKIEAPLAPVATPQASKKTVIEVTGVSADGLRGLIGRVRQDLETLGSTAKDELLAAGNKLEPMLRGASLKE